MKLQCVECHQEGKYPFEDSAPYEENNPNGLCLEHGPRYTPDVTHFYRHPKRDFRPGEEFSLLTSRRFVGMEFEMFHHTHNTDRPLDLSRDWRLLNCGIAEDGSISSRANIEIKTPPAQGDDAVLWAKAIGTIAPAYGMVVNKSCGLHVHVDIRDFNSVAVKRVGLLGLLVEPVLYAALPPERAYSMSSPLHINRKALLEVLQETAAVKSVWYKDQGGRHIGMNLAARERHGTLEFRYHSGTLNPTKVLHWLRICTGVVDAAASPRQFPTAGLGKP